MRRSSARVLAYSCEPDSGRAAGSFNSASRTFGLIEKRSAIPAGSRRARRAGDQAPASLGDSATNQVPDGAHSQLKVAYMRSSFGDFVTWRNVVAPAHGIQRRSDNRHRQALDPGQHFRDCREPMPASKRFFRLLALLQVLIVMPPLAGGSVCISTDGVARLEPGFCACMELPARESAAAIGVAGTAQCGPCRDEVFTASCSTTPPTCTALMTSRPHVPSCEPAVAAPVVGRRLFWAGEPPGRRLPILRC